jgi:hypothetical protein
LDIQAPDLPQSRGLMRAICSGHIRNLVMSKTCACLSLPRFAFFLLGFPGAAVRLGNRMARAAALEFVAWPPQHRV